MLKYHPAVYSTLTVLAKIKVFRDGFKLRQINEIFDFISQADQANIVDSLIPADATLPEILLVGAIGDGTIIAIIQTFFKSELGKMLIQMFADYIKNLLTS